VADPWDRTAIVGIGQTEFSRASGRSELRLAVECVQSALADAGLDVDDVDGLCTFDLDSTDPNLIATVLGMPATTFLSRSAYGGGGGCAMVMSAAMAVITGAADVVVAYRAMNERSGLRLGQVDDLFSRNGVFMSPASSFYTPYGIMSAAQRFAPNIATYMHEYGVSNADVAPVSVACRRHAAVNPAAHFYGAPISAADHQASRWIIEPVLRLLDCCLESDGGVALVIASIERARHLRQIPARLAGAAQGMLPPMRNYYGDHIGRLDDMRVAASKLWQASALRPEDIQTAVIYDHFAPMVLMQLEALGFCAPGEAKDFVAGGRIEIGGGLPINTHGGQLGEAYIHGINGIAEAVRQIRGSALNQVPDVEHVLVTSGPGVPTSALVLATP
jgi:acetyl-CoA acetyltransferase